MQIFIYDIGMIESILFVRLLNCIQKWRMCNPVAGWEKGQIEKNVKDSHYRLWHPGEKNQIKI